MSAQALTNAQRIKRIVPLFNRILVKRDDPVKETRGGIVLPDTKSNVQKGTVIAVGPGTRTDKGTPVPIFLKVGDEVMLPDYGGTKVNVEEETYFLFRESEILAKFSE
ncbi:unnamed protein product [Ceutorhynchus assimilis]|uniref:10 kDa heat shock protein, mitochondrial n=1 Tax=Ceutorhynchus assimilis TaxID=467358 RepID=A0A9N9QPE9_9CUCU|nr:unnamed protein product [Ceutorhynchus assimilis]